MLDINVDENREKAEVFVSYYPDNTDTYGLPSYRRYNCEFNNRGNLVEIENTTFILSFDSRNHAIEFNIVDEESYNVNTLDIKKDLVGTPFSCIWLDSMEIGSDI